MSYPVTYYCPHCETLVAVEREGYLDDKAVTPYPLAGWTYVDPTVAFGDDGATESSASSEPDGVRFVCGESDGVTWDPHTIEGDDTPTDATDTDGTANNGVSADVIDADGTTNNGADRADAGVDSGGCGEPFYLSFVRFEDGQEVDPRTGSNGDRVRLNLGTKPDRPRSPSGPSGPDGGGSGGFWG